ncbi:MAG: TraB/GumN family protein, partial [Ferruginibacter sp.]
MYLKHFAKILFFFLLSTSNISAQKKDNTKYNSLLWQITGHGLTKPSYLFGTMHVSSKMAFHLSDSFYYALKNVDAVALELNPESWQGQMVRLNELNENYTSYVQPAGNDYLTENSFRINKYDDVLKASLSTEPPVVNSLLYRSYKTKEDFEEDTFLDLYIFQTGRKLGKAPAGVEDYYESEKLVLEAYADMAKEKKKKDIDLDGESMASLVEKMQNAYRRGDLDLMDSLDNMMERSEAFREKFLYRRNEIQANSIDSIIQKTSLFAGVGAAHLPGSRGVIELLRKKGYTLRPIKMSDRDAVKKEAIDDLKVKVNFTAQQAADGMYSVAVPGHLYALKTAYQPLNRWQYADMNNGSYYLVTRVKTYAAFTGQPEDEVMKKIDSMLYENIPGKILSKKIIEKDGYKGYDISNRTRRGDLQRYQLFVTPFEILVFKMSGQNNYVAGEEANHFFSSIQLKKAEYSALNFKPAQGGFSMQLPAAPHQFLNNIDDGRWEYEAKDKATGDAYLIFKKSVYNFNFIEEDSFDLKLVEESFSSPDYFDKQISRKQTALNGLPALLVRERLKNGSVVNAACLLIGPHYYVLAQRTDNALDSSFSFLKSFKWQPYTYQSSSLYVDTFLHTKVNTPIHPSIDEGIRSVIEQSAADAANGNNYSGYIAYWPKRKNGLLLSDSTGELVAITMQEYPKYYYIRDSLKFWENEINNYLQRNDMLLKNQSAVNLPGNIKGIRFSLQDTGSSRTIERLILLKDKFMFTLATMGDTINKQSNFVNDVFESFVPLVNTEPVDLYENKLPVFFNDLFSADSALHKKAQQSISNVYFGSTVAVDLFNAINRLTINDKDYYNSKTKLIAELGFIKDGKRDEIPAYLKNIYEHVADTSLFQNEVIKALARLKTAASFKTLKEIMLQDPPIFEDDDYNSIFRNLEDTLALSAGLFP